jgi:hypothetical protein
MEDKHLLFPELRWAVIKMFMLFDESWTLMVQLEPVPRGFSTQFGPCPEGLQES